MPLLLIKLAYVCVRCRRIRFDTFARIAIRSFHIDSSCRPLAICAAVSAAFMLQHWLLTQPRKMQTVARTTQSSIAHRETVALLFSLFFRRRISPKRYLCGSVFMRHYCCCSNGNLHHLLRNTGSVCCNIDYYCNSLPTGWLLLA